MDYQELDDLFNELWPIPRSITGPGITQSLKILQRHIPFEIKAVASGTKVFDWVVPPEWQLNSATLYTADGEKILSTEDSNIHILNFSEPYSATISYEELEPHLYTNKTFPETVPYVTSYYQRRWGFCLSEAQKARLDKTKKYRVEIDTKIYPGNLRYGDLTLKGKSEKTVLLTSYLCHPSLANNELSGPLALVALYKELSKQKNRYYTYRFLVVPETIGSITFLANTEKSELDKICAGIVLTCLGGPAKKVTFKHSRRHWVGEPSEIDELVESLCMHDSECFEQRPFEPTSGSDERQFCSPTINLPVIQAARTPYGQYDEYHSSLDNKSFMRISAVLDSISKLCMFIRVFELNRANLLPMLAGGEPMLGKRGLYPTINSAQTKRMSSDKIVDGREQLNILLNVISLIDGKRTVKEIVEFLEISYDDILSTLEPLLEQNLVRV
ncbi:DUF4910 domain-containing protein [Idiomarina tyrosinivorans]|nr:DUF4910 domain-containing protein [Idiomarina tyrosinivorans]